MIVISVLDSRQKHRFKIPPAGISVAALP